MQLLKQLILLLLHHLNLVVQLVGFVNLCVELGTVGLYDLVELGFALLLLSFVKVNLVGHDRPPQILLIFVNIKPSLIIELPQHLDLTLDPFLLRPIFLNQLLFFKLNRLSAFFIFQLIFHFLKLLQSAFFLIKLNLIHHLPVVATSGFQHILGFFLSQFLVSLGASLLLLEAFDAVLHDLGFDLHFTHVVVIVEHQQAVVVDAADV